MEHEHHHKIVVEETDGTENKSGKDSLSDVNKISASILVGAIIIAAVSYYNGQQVVKLLNGKTVAGTQTGQNGQNGTIGGTQQDPNAPVTITDRDNQPTLGNKDAKVTVVEFADFQCPYCKNFFQTTFPQIKAQYIDTGKIKYVYRHFPLTSIHPNAQISGIGAECANEQGKFWEFHDQLFTSGNPDGTGLDADSLKKYANKFGLNNGNKFNQCLDGKSTEKIVNDDLAQGMNAGVTGTPSFFINGTKLVGAQPFEQFKQAIDAALAK